MVKRKIIKIDEAKCDGCGLCIPNCPEGALQIIDGKARLVNEVFCDGLGACIGHCPRAAIVIEEKDAQEYDEKRVMENIIKPHPKHLKEYSQSQYLEQAVNSLRRQRIEVSQAGTCVSSVCPGSRVIDFRDKKQSPAENKLVSGTVSQLQHWPIQIKLIPVSAIYLKDADLLISADCVPFTYADFHSDLLTGRILLIGCPKLDDVDYYQEKLTQILKDNRIRSITCSHMQVPCCSNLVDIIKSAILSSGKNIPFREIIITIRGEKIE